MQFTLSFSEEAKNNLDCLIRDKSKKGVLKQVRKVLAYMETNLKHPSLNTHKFDDLSCEFGQVFESYAQNHTPGAYRIFWCYGHKRGEIYILYITTHP